MAVLAIVLWTSRLTAASPPSQPKITPAPVSKKDTGKLPINLQLKERRERDQVVKDQSYRYVDHVLTVAEAEKLPMEWWVKPLTVIPPESCWNEKESNARVFLEIWWGPARQPDRKGLCRPLRTWKELQAFEFSLPEGRGIAETIQVVLRDRLTNIRHTSNVLSISGSEVDAVLLDAGCKRFLGRANDYLCTTATGLAACTNLQNHGKPIRCRSTSD